MHVKGGGNVVFLVRKTGGRRGVADLTRQHWGKKRRPTVFFMPAGLKKLALVLFFTKERVKPYAKIPSILGVRSSGLITF